MSSLSVKHLHGDHELILQALDVMREMTDRMERQVAVARGDLRLLLEFLAEFAHGYHDGKEQSILIPALLDAGHSLRESPLNDLISDHRKIHEAARNLMSALHSGNDKKTAKLSERYGTLLTKHLLDEERLLFDTVTESVDDLTDYQVWKQLNEFEPGLRERLKAKFDSVVRILDRKYQCTGG